MILHDLSKWYFKRSALPIWGVLACDTLIVLFSTLITLILRHGFYALVFDFPPYLYSILICLFIHIIFFRVFHTYAGVIRFSSFVDLKRVLYASASASAVIFLVFLALGYLGVSFIVLLGIVPCVGICAFTTMLMFIERVVVKSLYDEICVTPTTRKAFVYGVQAGGIAVAKSIEDNESAHYALAGFVSPNGENDSKYLMGVKVRRDGPNLVRHMKEAGATALIVSPLQTDHFRTRQELIDELATAHIKILSVPAPEEWDGKQPLRREKFREIEIEDLLPREPITINMDSIASQLAGKSILITGAAGSIGSEIVRQVAKFHPSNLILVDQAETPMHDLRLMMTGRYPDVTSETIVASITDESYMEMIFAKYHPEYVFHAAAYKHVPMMEDNPAMAVQNNICGTRIIADLAVKYRTAKFVMVSTDKAVNPTNIMGCSKRICEIYCQSLNRAIQDGKVEGITQFVTTRFGNVLGSNGSVIPTFREQIRRGGPLTVTHPDINRYFMLIPEACSLVLEAAAIGKGGEIFVFDMGKPVRIADLAKRMIALSGASDIKIEYTGLRDGEKLFEEILTDEERTKPTSNSKIFVATVREYDYAQACDFEKRLTDLSYTYDNLAIARCMQEIVPEYQTTNPIYKLP